MINRWNAQAAARFPDDMLGLRVYSTQLLGREPDLVLHGGGNTSVKTSETDIFGNSEETLWVKGSGQDMARIDAHGFAPVRLAVLKRLAALERLTDADLLRTQRSAMTDPGAPDPSIEAVVHAIIPFRFVDHTHADAVVTLTHTPDGADRIRHLYGDRVLIVPYVHPGIALAKAIVAATGDINWHRTEGIVLMYHGIFTFADDARTSYERMIGLVSEAEGVLADAKTPMPAACTPSAPDWLALSRIRRSVSRVRGQPVLACLNPTPEACDFTALPHVKARAADGPLVADHLIRIRPLPLILETDPDADLAAYADAYRAYFHRHAGDKAPCPEPSPRWAVWPGIGMIAFARTTIEAVVVGDIATHTLRAAMHAQAMGGWQGLSEKQVFDMEYWSLERAKLEPETAGSELRGKVALVTGAASGIGRACAEMLRERGAAVVGVDINPDITERFDRDDLLGVCCDVTDDAAVRSAVETAIGRFGGLDILIPNAGIFAASQNIEDLDQAMWQRSMEINLSSNQRLLKQCIPYLKQGIEAAVVFVASKNVPAPGPGAAAYSVAKAGLTQLARVAALELGPFGIRVNVVHPNAVYDTALWTPEVLESRACHYGCTVEEYKTNNCLKTEVCSRDVAALVCAMVGPAFAKTTGAQVPIDGGNERVI